MYPSRDTVREATTIPQWQRWALIAAFWLVIVVSLIIVAVIALGLTNPDPIGEVILMQEPNTRIIQPNAETVDYQSIDVSLSPPGSVEVIMKQAAGPPEASYGITLSPTSDASDQGISLRVSTSGLIEVTNADEAIMQPQMWPHIRGLGEDNRLRFDVRDEQVEVWVNYEFAVSFDWAAYDTVYVGVVTETLGRGMHEVMVNSIVVTQE